MEALNACLAQQGWLKRHLGDKRRICGISKLPSRRQSHQACRALRVRLLLLLSCLCQNLDRKSDRVIHKLLQGDANSGWSGNPPVNFRKLYSSNSRRAEETTSRSEYATLSCLSCHRSSDATYLSTLRSECHVWCRQKGDTATAAAPLVPKLQALTGNEPVRFWGWVLAALAFAWAGWNLCRMVLRQVPDKNCCHKSSDCAVA